MENCFSVSRTITDVYLIFSQYSIFEQRFFMKKSIQYIRENLLSLYDPAEIESFIFLIFNHLYGYSKKDMILNRDTILPEEGFKRIAAVVSRLEKFEPIQYILGETTFFGLKFKIGPGVLIPRFETEELVDLILKRKKNQAVKIIDLGTGSGCIAISLKKGLPLSTVWGCDISDFALNRCHENAQLNEAVINWTKYDILGEVPPVESGFDLIVSNPPYITWKEKALMQRNVVDFEPELALFVPDDDPLLFYRAIVQKSNQLLKAGGEIYFEINESYGNEIRTLLNQNGFDAEIIKDINGKDRFAIGLQRQKQ